MRARLACLVLGALLWPLATTWAQEEASSDVPIALGTLEGLEEGDAFIYELRVPAPGFVGAPFISGFPHAKVPRKRDDFVYRWIRFVVVEPPSDDLNKATRLRVDRVSEDGALLYEGLWHLELLADKKTLRATWYERDGTAHPTGGGIDGVPFIFFGSYPLVRGVHGGGTKVLLVHQERALLAEWSFTLEEPQAKRVPRTVSAEATYFSIPDSRTLDSLDEGEKKQRLNFFDEKSNTLLKAVFSAGSRTPLGYVDERTDNLLKDVPEDSENISPVLFDGVERQEWEVGMPLWKRTMRWDHRGIFLSECTLLERTKVELPKAVPSEPPVLPEGSTRQAGAGDSTGTRSAARGM